MYKVGFEDAYLSETEEVIDDVDVSGSDEEFINVDKNMRVGC